MLDKVKKASSAAAFFNSYEISRREVGGEAVPADSGSSTSYSEYRH